LLKLKGLTEESQLPDNVRRQFSAQMLKRKDFALSFASTTGAKLHSEEALNSGLLWIVALVEADPDNWIWSSILEKITAKYNAGRMNATQRQQWQMMNLIWI
jgi:hypothetical protein